MAGVKPHPLRSGRSTTAPSDATPTKRLWVDGCESVLVKLPPRLPTSTGDAEGRERSRYRVEVDGVTRGHIVYLQAWHGSWEARALGALSRHAKAERRLDSPYSADGTPFRPPSRDDLARRFPGWIAEGRAPSQEDLTAFRAGDAVAREREDRHLAQEREGREAERVARKARDQAVRQERHLVDTERLAVLQRLQERGAPILTNHEIDALTWALARLRGEIP